MVLNLIPAPTSLQEDLDPRASLPVPVAAVDLDDERLAGSEAEAAAWARTRDRAARTRGTDGEWLVPQDFALRTGDRVLAVDGNLVPDARVAVAAIRSRRPGSTVVLTVGRDSGRLCLSVRLATGLPRSAPPLTARISRRRPK
ncbi:PDZ domain-containing protein [Streptomyces murinus]|uniref:PDZ domain-containing protein n=1 Tax=Streptomyces murinus TaxID=33900 RepID=UPI0036ED9B13